MKAENGNALFLILIAVALFAALSYAITTSGRGGGGIDKETAELKAAQLIQKIALFDQAYLRLRTLNGCAEDQISFENPTIAGYTNAKAPNDKTCHFFDPNGAGLSYEMASDDILDSGISDAVKGQYIFTGNNTLNFLSGGTNAGELIVFLPFIDQEICEIINKKNQDFSGTPPRTNSLYTIMKTPFQGTYGASAFIHEAQYVDCVLFRNFDYGTNFSKDAFALLYPLNTR